MLNYLGRLIKQMDKRHFPHDDELRRVATEAYDKVHSLKVTLHYMSCDPGHVYRNKPPAR